MTYCVRLTRPLVDDDVYFFEVENKSTAALYIAAMVALQEARNPMFQVTETRGSPSDPELFVDTNTGIFHAYPKGD
jgi:hypothetical protein